MVRIAEIVVATVLLFMLFPMFVALSILLWVTMGSPILFRQQRTGRAGVPFLIYKFRTMTNEAGQRGDLTVKADARITPLGRFLRQYKLDELPQLINILKGDMAFVGPRPELPNWTARYSLEERAILRVRPGLTDPVQLLFRHEQDFLENAAQYELLFREKVAMQLQYQAVRTLSTDFGVMIQTIPAILRHQPGTDELAVYERIRRLVAQTEKQ